MTVDEYVRVVRELSWENTELLRGIVYDVTPHDNRHASWIAAIYDGLRAAFPHDRVLPAGSVALSGFSLVEPDVYVYDGAAEIPPESFVPGKVLKIAVEVSLSPLSRDLGPELRAYAEAGVPELWVLEPRPGSALLLRHSDPEGSDRRDGSPPRLDRPVGAVLGYRSLRQYDVGPDPDAFDVSVVLDA